MYENYPRIKCVKVNVKIRKLNLNFLLKISMKMVENIYSLISM